MLEAFAADVGRSAMSPRLGRRDDERRAVRALRRAGRAGARAGGAGSLAVTLGETGDLPRWLVVAVGEGSEAERAGIARRRHHVHRRRARGDDGGCAREDERSARRRRAPDARARGRATRSRCRESVRREPVAQDSEFRARSWSLPACERDRLPVRTLHFIVLSPSNVKVCSVVRAVLVRHDRDLRLVLARTLYVPLCLSRGVTTVISSPWTSISVSVANEFAAHCASGGTPSALFPFHLPSRPRRPGVSCTPRAARTPRTRTRESSASDRMSITGEVPGSGSLQPSVSPGGAISADPNVANMSLGNRWTACCSFTQARRVNPSARSSLG